MSILNDWSAAYTEPYGKRTVNGSTRMLRHRGANR